ncbi:hypothetical protein GCM10017687_22390 [Streptomyces echinatus]
MAAPTAGRVARTVAADCSVSIGTPRRTRLIGTLENLHLRCKLNGRGVGHPAKRIGHYGCRCEQARWARAQYTCRTGGVQGEDARAIKVRNAREMVLWWDAQVPDRLPWYRRQAA